MSSLPPPSDTTPGAKPRERSTTDASTAYMDGMRALAANLVVVSHVILVYFENNVNFPVRGMAVTFLFILSGFLICQSLLQRSRKPGPHLPNFLADRAARILTPLIPAICMIALLNLWVIESRMGGDGLSTGIVAFFGNIFLLLDYPVFQALAVAGIDVPWRIRPYNTAEPYWTVAIEFWLYIAASLLVFGVLFKEPVRRGWLLLLAAISLPVVIWNAADGPGQSLSLIWILGGMAGFLVHYMGKDSVGTRSRTLGLWIAAVALLSLGGRVVKVGFNPYDLQTAFLLVAVFLGVFMKLNQIKTVPALVKKVTGFMASYSYSLYLVHNTVLVVVFEHADGLPKPLAVALGVGLAHLTAYAFYHAFEKRHRTVGTWLRPRFARLLMRKVQPVTAPAPAPAVPVAPTPAAPVLPSPADVLGGAVAAAAAVATSLVPTENADGTGPALGGGLAPQ